MALRFSTGLRNKLLGINTNMLTNGDFSTDTTGWTAVDATLASVGSGQSGNCLEITETGGANPGKAYQDVTTKVGHKYMLVVYFKKGTSDHGKVMIGTTADEDAIFDSGNLTDAAWALVKASVAAEMVFVATETTTRITFQTNDADVGETSLFDTASLVHIEHSVQDIFNEGFINFYSGTQPGSADNAVSGTLLVTMYSDGASAGLNFDDAVSSVLSKAAAETWSGTAVATATAGWFRLYAEGDALGSSTVDARMDGAISTSGAELNMASTAIVASSVISINTWQLSMDETQ